MRVGSVLLVGSSVIALVAAVACQPTVQTKYVPVEQPDENEPAEQEEGDGDETKAPSEGNTDDTCLGKASLAFDDVECNECMSDDASCCQATITCFKDDPECATLHSCILGCGGGAGGSPTAIFNNEVYPKVDLACGSCHRAGTGGAAIFFAADAAGTYTLFKQRSYHLPNSLFVTKGLHTGPALTPDQRAAVDKWVAAEAKPDGGGGGGGNGTGGGNGNGGGNGGGGGGMDGGGADAGDSAACKDACKAQHPNALTKWQAYNTCAAVTCKAQCL